MFNKSLLFLLVFCNFTFAENFVIPEQKIVGAEVPIPLGELVDLSISPIQSTPKFLVSTTYSWKVFDGYIEKRIRNYENGVFFGSGIQAKKLKVIVSITHLYVVKDNEKLLEAATRTILFQQMFLLANKSLTLHQSQRLNQNLENQSINFLNLSMKMLSF